MLLEALTGRREYPGRAMESALARLHRVPAVPAGLPGGLTALLAAMTDPDTAARPTAAQVAAALDPAGASSRAADRPITAPVPALAHLRPDPAPVGPARSGRHQRPRRSFALPVAATLLLVGLVGVLAVVMGIPPLGAEAAEPVTTVPRLPAGPRHPRGRSGPPRLPLTRLAPDSARLSGGG